MKANKIKEEVWTPIIITLETKQEFIDLLALVSIPGISDPVKSLDELYEELTKHISSTSDILSVVDDRKEEFLEILEFGTL